MNRGFGTTPDQPFKDEIDLSIDPYSVQPSGPAPFSDPNNQQSPSSPQPPPRFGQRRNDYMAKNYNDILERQGIPAISPEDLAILRECAHESFMYRCFPITAALCGGLVYSARMKQFQPKFYHFLGAVFFGYFAGKISYRSKCEEKLINSKSNSPFVNAIRKRKGLFVNEYEGANLPDQSMESDWTTAQSSQSKSYGMGEFDEETAPLSSQLRSRNPGFLRVDDFGSAPEPPDNDLNGGGGGGENPPSSGGGLSYDDLRKRNRSMFKNI